MKNTFVKILYHSKFVMLFLLLFFLVFNASAKLSGTYTIDASGSGSTNFTTFGAAIKQLKDSGVNGAVIFKIADGTYTEKISIPAISGTSATNTITFTSASNDSTKVILTYASSSTTSSGNYTLEFNGCSRIVFDKITIIRTGVLSYGNVIYIGNKSGYNTISHCRLIGVKLTTYGTAEQSVIASPQVTNSFDSFNNFHNNFIKYGYHGFYLFGVTTSRENGNVITDNIIDSTFYSAIVLSYQKSFTVTGNKISNIVYGGFGLYGYTSTGACVVSKNSFTLPTKADGIYLSGIVNKKDTLVVSNNMISCWRKSGMPNVISISSCYYTSVYNNNILANRGNGIYTWGSKTSVLNNCIMLDSGYCLSTSSTLYRCDFNCFYPGTYGYIGSSSSGNSYRHLPTWQKATSPAATDAEIRNIDSPAIVICGKSVYIKLVNAGTDTLKSATINWVVDGTTQTAYSWSGSLSFGASTNINIGSYSFGSTGTHTVKVYSSSPNGKADGYTGNDTLEKTKLSIGISGKYTIGSSGNYTTFAAAVTDVVSRGICNSIIFDVADGSYKEQVDLLEVKGSSPTKTITFQSANLDSTKVILYYPASSTSTKNYLLSFDHAYNYVFRKMTLQRTFLSTNTYASIIVLNNNTKNLVFENNIMKSIVMSSSSTVTNQAHVYSKTIYDCDTGIIVRNNLMKYGAVGVYMYLNSNFKESHAFHEISFNTMDSIYDEGIHLRYNYSFTINNNTITNILDKSGAGIYIDYTEGFCKIYKNKLNGLICSNGLYISGNKNSSTDSMAVNNNFISLAGINPKALYVDYGGYNGMSLLYNSVLYTGSNNSSYVVTLKGNGSKGIVVYNNLFIAKTGSIALNIGSNALFKSDFNDIYCKGTDLVLFNSAYYKTLADFQSKSGFDSNSISIDPGFVSTTDLHLKGNSVQKGKPIWITDDIDNSPRGTKITFIGAHEYQLIPHDLKFVSTIFPLPSSCGDSFSKLMVIVKNEGTKSETNFDVYSKINGGAPTKITCTKTLAPGASDTLVFSGTINTYAGGMLSFKSYTDLSTDMLHNNDTLLEYIPIHPGPIAANGYDGFNCSTGVVKIVAKGKDPNYKINWYSSPTSSTILASGDTFLTPSLNSDSTFYASVTNVRNYKAGSPYKAGGTSSYFYTYKAGLMFRAFQDFSLDTVSIYPDASGKIVINLLDSIGNIIGWDTSTVITKTKGKEIKYALYDKANSTKGFSLKKGNSYSLQYAPVSGSPNLFTEVGSSLKYPYTTLGILNVIGSTDKSSPQYTYYYFYNWKVSLIGDCEGPNRVAVTAHVNKNITGSSVSKGSLFNGAFKSGTKTDPDMVCQGNTINYSISSPTGYTNSDYNKKWKIMNISVKTKTGISSTDTVLQYPSSKDFSISFSPKKINTPDSLFILTAWVTNPDGSCPVNIMRYIKVSSIPTANFGYDKILCEGTPLKFSDSSKTDSLTNYLWNFGDVGSSTNASTSVNPTHIFDQSGVYKVKLILMNNGGCGDTAEKSFRINAAPSAKIKILHVDSSSNKVILTPEDTSSVGFKYDWTFGDGYADNIKTPSHKYKLLTKTYRVKLTVTNPDGCTSIDSLDADFSTVGIQKNESSNFKIKIAPNPFFDELNLSYSLNKTSYFSASLYDVMGNKIIQLTEGIKGAGDYNLQLNQSLINLPEGMYLIRIKSDEGVYFLRAIKINK
ncbi:MAG: PKD domain-containing protein [Bacteroidetes bacterium]|nr:PKD domain-containing protein [Bacteroidota bacterium]